jgi:hypothetical protein
MDHPVFCFFVFFLLVFFSEYFFILPSKDLTPLFPTWFWFSFDFLIPVSEKERQLRAQGQVPHLNKAMALFSLCTIMNGFPAGQKAVLSKGLEELCLSRVSSPSGLVRRWACLCLAGMWSRFDEGGWTHECGFFIFF